MESLLFCQDEKSARALIPLVEGLNISVKHETEVFSAMRSLMAESFDLLIIDCEDEATMRLLLRNAHGSPANKTALVVAVVARETGANALRFGADFLVTKPIMPEQAARVLRLARISILRMQQISPAQGASTTRAASSEAAFSESSSSSAKPAPVVNPTTVEASAAGGVVAGAADTVVMEADQEALSKPAVPAAESIQPAQLPEADAALEVAGPPDPVALAVTKTKNTPSRFFRARTAAIIAAVLLIVAAIAWNRHFENSDSAATPAQPAASTSAPPHASTNRSAAQAPAALQTPEQAAPGAVTAEPSAVSIAPKYNNEEGSVSAEKVKPGPATSAIVPGKPNLRSPPPSSLGTRTIRVASGGKSAASLQSTSLTASISVNSVPPEAALWMDGRDTGRMTPAQISVDQPGNHTLVFKKQGYLDETTVADLRIGQTFQLAPTLRALGRTDDIKMVGTLKKILGDSPKAGMGTLSVKTQPKGAQIAVNTRTLDKPSPAEFYLNPGNYVIDVTSAGFKTIHRVVSIDKGRKVAIDEVMDRE